MLQKNQVSIFKAVALALVVLYLLSGFTTVYIDPDVIIYTIIGDAIFRDGALPYAYIFDHKPVGTYYFYGLFHLIYPLRYGLFTFMAIVGALVTTVAACRAFGLQRYQLWFFVAYVLFGANYGYFTGNTEVITNALIATSIALLMLAGEGKSIGKCLLAGVLAAVAINVNYLSGVVLSLPTLMLLFRHRAVPWRIVAYAVGVAAGLLLVFAPYLISGASIAEYLELQRRFGSGYGLSLKERAKSMLESALLGMYFVPLFVAYWVTKALPQTASAAVADAVEVTRTTMVAGPARVSAIVESTSLHREVGHSGYDESPGYRPVVYAWAASATAATLVSGHGWHHYFLLVIPPLVVMAITLLASRRITPALALVVAVPLLLYSALGCAYWIQSAYANGRAIDAFDQRKISDLVGSEPVLNIRSSHVLLYLARLRSMQPFVFPDQPRIIFGDKEDEQFAKSIEAKPGFVLTGYRLCSGEPELPAVCERIAKEYVAVAESDDPRNPAFAYSLYRLKR